MRYADRIIFVRNLERGGYNPDTGNHDESIQAQDIQACNTTSLGVDRTVQLFGTMDKEVLVARLQRPYTKEVDFAILNNTNYSIKQHAKHRNYSVFYLEAMS